MSYIRIKKINNSPYAYLVESFNTSSGPRQKVKQYLGRVYEFEKKMGEVINSKVKNKEDLLLNLVLSELQPRGFKEKRGKFCFNKIDFNPEHFTIKKKTKNIVLAFNDGYLCDFTLQRILNFKKSNDLNHNAHQLAKYFLEAGLQISEEDFVKFYQLL